MGNGADQEHRSPFKISKLPTPAVDVQKVKSDQVNLEKMDGATGKVYFVLDGWGRVEQ